jgi:hypothetical protein
MGERAGPHPGPEIMGPSWRRSVMLPCQAVCIFLLFVVVGGIIPHYWFPVHYRWFLWFLTGVNLVIAVALFFRMPESPRWCRRGCRYAAGASLMASAALRAASAGRWQHTPGLSISAAD